MNIDWGTLNETQYFRNIYYSTKSEKDKLDAEVKFLRKRKSELDAELKRCIEANDKHDKKLNEKYWQGYENGQKELLNKPGQVFKCEISNRGSEAYLDGFKAGIEWLNGVLKK